MIYDKYNIDIVIETESEEPNGKGLYLLEVNGVYFHGLIDLPKEHKFY